MAVVIKGSGSIEGSTGLEMGANGTTEIRGQVNVAVGSSVAGVSTATSFTPTEIPTSNRNLIINGAMQVAQRSTSVAITGAGYHTVDRFATVANSSMSYAVTMSQEADGPTGFEKCVKLLTTSASTPSGSHNYRLRYKLEAGTTKQFGWGTADSKAGRLSFWVKSNKTGTYTSQIYLYGVSTTITMTAAYTISSSATWEKKTIIIPAYTTTWSPATGASAGCSIDWGLADGPDDVTSAFSWTTSGTAKAVTGQVNLLDTVNNYWQLTGVQLEVGEQATAFEHKPYTDEYNRCIRYFWLIANGSESAAGSGGSGLAPICTGNAYTSSSVFGVIPFPTRMRTAPSIYKVTSTDYWDIVQNNNNTQADDVSVNRSSTTSVTLNFSTNLSVTANYTCHVRTYNSSARLGVQAEL